MLCAVAARCIAVPWLLAESPAVVLQLKRRAAGGILVLGEKGGEKEPGDRSGGNACRAA